MFDITKPFIISATTVTAAATASLLGKTKNLFQNQTIRSFAFITGHKKTTRRNKKKHLAKLLKLQKKKKKKKRNSVFNAKAHQRSSLGDLSGLGTYVPREKKLTKRQRLHERVERIARSPDYPVPREHQDADVEVNNLDENGNKLVPPAVLTSTASAHVFVSKIACEEAGLEAPTLFVEMDPRRPLPGTFYEFLKPSFGDQYPPSSGQPEVAFLGRSNVGKSSLINSIIRQKLATTSKTPGRTQSEYYYGYIPASAAAPPHASPGNRQHNPGMYHPRYARSSGYAPNQALGFLVDLPGYGFASAPDDLVGNWQDATQDWLVRRRDAGTLKRVYLLQDARLGVPQLLDNWVAEWMEKSEIPHTIVLTKADNVTADGNRTARIVKHANLISMRFHHLYQEAAEGATVYMSPFVHVTSSKKNTGIAEMVGSVLAELHQNQATIRSDDDDDEEDEDGEYEEDDDGEEDNQEDGVNEDEEDSDSDFDDVEVVNGKIRFKSERPY